MSKFKEVKRKITRSLFPKYYIKKIYKNKMGVELNLNPPINFNEKIQWLKLYELPYNPLVIKYADKYQLPKNLIEQGLSQYAAPVIGAWNSFEEIPLASLPDQFVLKINNTSSANWFINNKKTVNWRELQNEITYWLKRDYGLITIERHYSKIPSKVIAEEYLQLNEERLEYNFYCFHGKVKFCNVIRFDDIQTKDSTEASYTANWEYLDFHLPSYHFSKEIEKPENLEEMLRVSEQISRDFLFVRVDFMVYQDRTILGELTFSPASGFDNSFTDEALNIMGSWLDLSKSKHYKG